MKRLDRIEKQKKEWASLKTLIKDGKTIKEATKELGRSESYYYYLSKKRLPLGENAPKKEKVASTLLTVSVPPPSPSQELCILLGRADDIKSALDRMAAIRSVL